MTTEQRRKYELKRVTIREDILRNGVKNLTDFGYNGITKESLIKVKIMAMFFKSMLLENIESLEERKKTDTIEYETMKELLSEIDKEHGRDLG